MLCQELINEYQAMEGIKLGIDRIVIGIPSPKIKLMNDNTDKCIEEELVKEFKYKKENFIKNWFHIKNTITSDTKHKIIKNDKNISCYMIYSDCEKEKKICGITVGWKYGNYILNIAFNPNNLTLDNIAELKGLFSTLFFNHYEEIYEKGVVSRCEFFVDMLDIKPNDLVLIDTGKRKTSDCFGTTYHGTRKSKLCFTMYDKAAQLKIDGKLTRIEARIKRRDIRFMELVENGISNPFNSIFIIPNNALLLIAQDWKNPQLADKIKELGVYGATKGNAPARKELLKRLKKHTMPWWQPDLIWEIHKKMLLEFKPIFLGGSIE